MSAPMNNRRNVRVLCGASARVEAPDGPIRGICRNLSVGGLFFLGGVLPIGRITQVTIDLPDDGRVQALGDVRYHFEYPEGLGMGIKFARIAQEHLAMVAQFIESNLTQVG